MPPAGHHEFWSPEGARAPDPLLARPGERSVPDDGASEPTGAIVGEPMIAPQRGDDSDAGTDAPEAWVGPEPTHLVTDQVPGDGLLLDQPPTGPVSAGPVLPVRAPVDPTPIGSDVPPEPEQIDPEPKLTDTTTHWNGVDRALQGVNVRNNIGRLHTSGLVDDRLRVVRRA